MQERPVEFHQNVKQTCALQLVSVISETVVHMSAIQPRGIDTKQHGKQLSSVTKLPNLLKSCPRGAKVDAKPRAGIDVEKCKKTQHLEMNVYACEIREEYSQYTRGDKSRTCRSLNSETQSWDTACIFVRD
jgi:hypothetical protein